MRLTLDWRHHAREGETSRQQVNISTVSKTTLQPFRHRCVCCRERISINSSALQGICWSSFAPGLTADEDRDDHDYANVDKSTGRSEKFPSTFSSYKSECPQSRCGQNVAEWLLKGMGGGSGAKSASSSGTSPTFRRQITTTYVEAKKVQEGQIGHDFSTSRRHLCK